MQKITLINLILRNFKGMKHFELNTSGNSAAVYGDNATGKTSLVDAFLWLFTGKDSQGKQAESSIKTLTANGDELHHLNHEAEAVLSMGGRTVTLKKAYREIWTKKRGAATESFTGHETEHFIDGVPKSKKEYDAFVSGIAAEETFRLLTNPAYFNTQLHWQDRRRILMDVCGDVSDEEVIASESALKRLPEILNGRKLDDHRKVIASRKAELNKQLKEIPARIDEATRALPNIEAISMPEVIETELSSLKNQLAAKQQEAARVKNGGEIAEKQRQLREAEGQLLDIQNRYRTEYSDTVHTKRIALQRQEATLDGVETKMSKLIRQIAVIRDEINKYEFDVKCLRDKWHEESSREFTFAHDSTCPTCGQDLPEEEIEAAKQKALDRFNLNKSQKLEDINADGKSCKEKIMGLQANEERCHKKINELAADKAAIEKAIAALQAELDAMGEAPNLSATPEYVKATQSKTAIQDQIDAINSQQETVLRQIQTEIDLLGRDIAAREKSLALLEQHHRGRMRITELTEQEKALAAEFEGLEGELYLTEQFIRTKVNLLESRINSKFEMARFKMFEQQVNEGIKECCETLCGGVPYSGGLNNAAKINVGLDILNTLSQHYNFSAPIFIDNAESVTELIPVNAQVITLVVSKPDKVLRVESGQAIKTADLGLFKEAI